MLGLTDSDKRINELEAVNQGQLNLMLHAAGPAPQSQESNVDVAAHTRKTPGKVSGSAMGVSHVRIYLAAIKGIA